MGVSIQNGPSRAQPAPSTLPDVKKTRAGEQAETELLRYIALKLAALGHPIQPCNSELLDIAQPLLCNYRQKDLILATFFVPPVAAFRTSSIPI